MEESGGQAARRPVIRLERPPCRVPDVETARQIWFSHFPDKAPDLVL